MFCNVDWNLYRVLSVFTGTHFWLLRGVKFYFQPLGECFKKFQSKSFVQFFKKYFKKKKNWNSLFHCVKSWRFLKESRVTFDGPILIWQKREQVNFFQISFKEGDVATRRTATTGPAHGQEEAWEYNEKKRKNMWSFFFSSCLLFCHLLLLPESRGKKILNFRSSCLLPVTWHFRRLVLVLRERFWSPPLAFCLGWNPSPFHRDRYTTQSLYATPQHGLYSVCIYIPYSRNERKKNNLRLFFFEKISVLFVLHKT